MESQTLNTHSPNDFKHPALNYQHQYLPDLSLIHEMFVDLWFKHINYFESHSGQLPAENLKFIDGLNFVECCFLQNEMDMMADVVAEYMEQDTHTSTDFYTVEFDMKAQVSAYMNYIDQRLTTLHHLHGLMNQNLNLSTLPVLFGEGAKLGEGTMLNHRKS
jgi:hypothetical protein